MKSDDILTRAREGLTRHLTIRQIDADARTVEVAFASDTPVERFFGTEVLAITPAAIRLDRMTGGAAVLMDHRWDDQIGVVEGVTIGTDGVARAVLRFGKGTRADEVFQDIKDGIRLHVSVGYMVHKIEVEAREGQADHGDCHRLGTVRGFDRRRASRPGSRRRAIGGTNTDKHRGERYDHRDHHAAAGGPRPGAKARDRHPRTRSGLWPR